MAPCRDPLHAFFAAQVVVDRLAADHPAITDENHVLAAEVLAYSRYRLRESNQSIAR